MIAKLTLGALILFAVAGCGSNSNGGPVVNGSPDAQGAKPTTGFDNAQHNASQMSK